MDLLYNDQLERSPETPRHTAHLPDDSLKRSRFTGPGTERQIVTVAFPLLVAVNAGSNREHHADDAASDRCKVARFYHSPV